MVFDASCVRSCLIFDKIRNEKRSSGRLEFSSQVKSNKYFFLPVFQGMWVAQKLFQLLILKRVTLSQTLIGYFKFLVLSMYCIYMPWRL